MGGAGAASAAEGDPGGAGGAGVSRGGARRLLLRLAERKLARDAAARAGGGGPADGAADGAGAGAAPSASVYAGKEYWDARYRASDAAGGAGKGGGAGRDEWYAGFEALRPHIERAIPAGAAALVVGSGLSRLGEDLTGAGGCSRVVACDISEESVARMRAMQVAGEAAREVAYEVADCRALPYRDAEFDAVIDKGTLDTMMQADAPEPPREMLIEACRVLRPGGVFLSVSYGDAEMRRPELERPELPWTHLFSDTLQVGKATYFIYAYVKRPAGPVP